MQNHLILSSHHEGIGSISKRKCVKGRARQNWRGASAFRVNLSFDGVNIRVKVTLLNIISNNSPSTVLCRIIQAGSIPEDSKTNEK